MLWDPTCINKNFKLSRKANPTAGFSITAATPLSLLSWTFIAISAKQQFQTTNYIWLIVIQLLHKEQFEASYNSPRSSGLPQHLLNPLVQYKNTQHTQTGYNSSCTPTVMKTIFIKSNNDKCIYYWHIKYLQSKQRFHTIISCTLHH